MSDTSSKFCIFSLKSVGPLVRWSPLLTLSPKSPGFKPQTGQKRRTKNQSSTRQTIRNQNQIFHGFKPESTNETSDRNFVRDFGDRNFGFYKKHTKSHPKFRLSGNRKNSRSFGRKWILFDVFFFSFSFSFQLSSWKWILCKKNWIQIRAVIDDSLLYRLIYFYSCWFLNQ
jgi:hypothetical protein